MTRLYDAKAWPDWLKQRGIDRVVVISPHLDDAVFSVAGLLKAASGLTEVITLITAAPPGPPSEWTRATGFADNEAESTARRREDVAAMTRLGCRYRHEGLSSGERIEALARRVASGLHEDRPGGLAGTLVLLPAGAGAPPPRSLLRRLLRRALRRPVGALPHGEHVQARDHFWQAMAGSDASLGFYAELPYAWAQSDRQLQQHLHGALGCVTEQLQFQPDVEDKLELIGLYASQVAPILGPPAHRRRVLARGESLFIAWPPGPPGAAAAR